MNKQSVFLIPWYISQAYSNNAIYHINAEKILMMQSAWMVVLDGLLIKKVGHSKI